jgi:hypothetical protein
MFKRLFPFASEEHEPQNGTTAQSPASRPVVVQAIAVEPPREPSANPTPAADNRAASRKIMDFEEIYQTAHFKPPKLSYSILKVVEMASSPHLSGMSAEAKRSALLMALDAAGVETEDLLQDAMLRQRALNEAQEALARKLEEFEAAKAKENSQIQAELERLTAEHLARIQANMDQVASEQDAFRAWEKRKQQEAQRIADAAANCIPQGNAQNSTSLTILLERASSQRR